MEKLSLDKITSAYFEMDQMIHIHFNGGAEKIAGRVTELNEIDQYSPLERVPFSVVFQTEPKPTASPQGIYPVEIGEGRIIDLFLVLIGHDKNGIRYEAIFS